MKILIQLLTLNLLLFNFLQAQNCKYSINNEVPPNSDPIIYGKGTISRDSMQLYGISFSPDGDELVYSVKTEGVYYMKKVNDKWTTPKLLDISKNAFTHIMYPKFSPNGKLISFVDGNSKQYGFGDIFIIERKPGNTWSGKINLPKPINSEVRDAGHSYTLDGKLYFTSNRADSDKLGNNSLFRAVPEKNGETKIELLGRLCQFCIPTDEESVFISPKEEYVIFDSWHKGSKRKQDLYISYRLNKDDWTDPKPLNSKINTEQFEGAPFVTSDDKFLFFTRSTQNKSNILWVSTKEVFEPYQKLQIPEFHEKVNQKIEIKFSRNTFADFNGEVIGYEVTLRDKGRLPDWLTFNKNTMILSGAADKAGSLNLLLRAIDNDENVSEVGFIMVIE